ncbi:MAG TPA: GNAT family N-acetyltransferase [Gemmatimonadales bacterium]|nr:GNAT family N-acetyltransferase [Gemmatimonadales bacterium]
MRIHVEALFTRDSAGRLLRVNEPDGNPAPRFFLGRTPEGNEWRFRADLPGHLVAALETACRDENPGPELLVPPYGAKRYEALLAPSAPIVHRWAGPAFCFVGELPPPVAAIPVTEANLDLLRPHLEDWCPDALLRQPALMVLDEGRAVSLCCSVRQSPLAHEAGVETAPAFRGRGYATRAATAWAVAVRRLGRLPLYSTSWQNAASRALAGRLGLERYGTDLHFT